MDKKINKKIWANTIVNNEENFIWFSVMSVEKYVDKIFIWDTKSTDHTLDIIKELKKKLGDKVIFKEVGEADKNQFTKLRQKMLNESNCDWILILDGDEIWWDDSINKLTDVINKQGDKLAGIVVPMKVPVGDIFHLQEERAGQYQIMGKKGHISLKAINRKIPKLHLRGPYGEEGFFDQDNKLIQQRKDLLFLNAPFLHATHLKRSNQKRKTNKFKYEIGTPTLKSFKFPEVFYKDHPSTISSVWVKITGFDLIKAMILTPLRKIKRSIS